MKLLLLMLLLVVEVVVLVEINPEETTAGKSNKRERNVAAVLCRCPLFIF